MTKIPGVTFYEGFTKFYFLRILNKIIKIGNLTRTNKMILDFGCGFGILKETLGSKKVINFDIVEELSDVKDWKTAEFEILVANQVFSSFNKNSLIELLNELRIYNHNLTVIVGTSRRGILNKIGMYISGRLDSHDSTNLSLEEEMSLYSQVGLEVEEKQNIFFLCDILKMRFDNKCDDL